MNVATIYVPTHYATTILELTSNSLTAIAVRELYDFTGVQPAQLPSPSIMYFLRNFLHFGPGVVPLIDNEHFVHCREIQVHSVRYVITAARLPQHVHLQDTSWIDFVSLGRMQ